METYALGLKHLLHGIPELGTGMGCGSGVNRCTSLFEASPRFRR